MKSVKYGLNEKGLKGSLNKEIEKPPIKPNEPNGKKRI